MNRQLGLGLAAGLLSALGFLSLVKGIALGAMLSYVAPLPLMMAGLALGTGATVIAGCAAIAAVAAVAGGLSALAFAISAALPALVVASRALLWRQAADGSDEWYPPGHVLAWLTAAGLVLLLSGAALLAGTPEGVKASVADTISHTLSLVAAELPEKDRNVMVAWWTPVFPAMVVGSWLVMSVVNAAGAQGLVARLGKARRLTPAYRKLMLPDWLGFGLAVFALGAVIGRGDLGYVAANAAVLLLIPFILLGLAVIHRWAKGRPNAGLVLALTYGLLILAFGWAAAAVAGLGLVRFWKMKFRRPDSGGGMEG